MTIHKNHGKLTVECNCCNEVLDPDTSDFNEVLEAIRAAEWKPVKTTANTWEHRCTGCK